ncbi:related to SVF1-like protein YDR222W [Saccharomycodes ludwigii]|uniref:Related to SVF1-like protein YDR222W n=1 Tax=Saccharomycodes ludwigii TaxID=36035 RepID=A0A376B6L6_9ASCO|nr:hypothetical protein SCDLUD_001905 [Saccharomycodes ludwigii]KAH3902092.1 hypothetical protein SCDLUD_001905 [Saccharomycodes ludwigii]SSD60219.1 related to SVF1-like protein YDR222W [Saccharomycodes ludwigii]
MTELKHRFLPVDKVDSIKDTSKYTVLKKLQDFSFQSVATFSSDEKNINGSNNHSSSSTSLISGGFGLLKKAVVGTVHHSENKVETQTFYFTDLDSGKCGLIQFVFSKVMGGLYKSVQLNFKLFSSDPNENKAFNFWQTIKLGEIIKFTDLEFKTKECSMKIKNTKDKSSFGKMVLKVDIDNYCHPSDSEESDNNEQHDHIHNTDSSISLHIFLNVYLTGEGFKINNNGCNYYFDKLTTELESNKFVRHVFIPRGRAKGEIKVKSEKLMGGKEQILTLKEVPTLYIGAVQALKPHKAAKAWNFVNYQSKDTAIVVMEFTTIKEYGGPLTVTFGCVHHKGKLVEVYSNNKPVSLNAEEYQGSNGYKADERDGYRRINCVQKNKVEGKTQRVWKVPTAIECPEKLLFSENNLQLVATYDIIKELPSIVRKLIENIAGIKPYLFQYCQNSTVEIHGHEEKGISIVECTYITK